MKISDVCIRRPVFTVMMMAALIVLGLFSFARLGVDAFPNVEFPIAIVTTSLPGASPEEVETALTKPIEEAVNTISGIDELRSISYEGLSQVIVTFVLEKNADVAAQEVRDAVGRVQRDFPNGTQAPAIEKLNPSAMPVMSIAVTGDMPLRELTQIAKKRIKENIENVKGVGRVTIVGGREREIHAVINPLKLAAYGLDIKRVKDALEQQNVEIPGGRVDQERRELILRTMGRIEKPEDFGKIIVANVRGVPVRIRDVGRVEDTSQEPRSLSRLDGREAVSLIVEKQAGTNTVETIQAVKDRLDEIRPLLPRGVRAEVIRDQSGFIIESVRTVEEHLILGAILASIAVLVFIGSVRSTLIAATAIPTSIIATFILMDRAGFTLNMMTLLALALAVGIVIDDAIVILENIFRHMEEKGIPAAQAASEAVQEIGPAVMATTLSLLIIFLPLAYMGGMIGKFMRSYGLTIAFAIAVSLFVAFTLTPMLCSRFLRLKHGPKGPFERRVDALNDFLKERYGRMVVWSLHHRWTVVAIAAAIVLSTPFFLKMVGKDFLPPDDSGEFEIRFKAPEGTSLTATDSILRQIEAEVRRLPGVMSLMASAGEGEGSNVNDATLYVRLKPWRELERDQFEVMAMARRALAKYDALRLNVAPVAHISGSAFRNADLNYFLVGPDLDGLRTYSDAIVKGLRAVP
ncbi:MAG: efflux RND transporter permease subunit, partial [candidate division NC10 bacterium]